MEYRQLGRSGLKVSVYSFGAMTFGGSGGFSAVGDTGVALFRRNLRRAIEAVQRGEDPPFLYNLGGKPTPTYGNDRIVPLSAVNGDPDDKRVLRQYARAIVKDYLEHPPLGALVGEPARA